MKKITKIAGVSLSFLMGVSMFAGCGGRGSASVEPFVNDYDPSRDYNISFLGWGDAKEQEIYRRIINDFMAEHPNIHVSYDASSAGEYLTKLTGEIADLPDVFYLPDTEFLQWVDGGHLLNLLGENGDGVDQEGLKNVWDNAVNEYYYNPETFALGKSEGAGMFALPKDQGPFTLAYNIDLVNQRIAANHLENDEEVKALLSHEPVTWTVFRSAMKKLLAGSNNLYGIPYYELEHAVYSNNAEFFDEEVKTSRLTSTAFVDAVQFIGDLCTDGITPNTGLAGNGDGADMAFYNGTALMTFVGHWDFATIWDLNNFHCDLLPVPYGPGPDRAYGTADDGKSTAFIGSMGYCVAYKTKERGTSGASLMLAEYLCMNEGAQRKFYSFGQCVPNLKDMAYNEYVPDSLGVLADEGHNDPAHRNIFIEIVDGFKDANDKIGGKPRVLYQTYFSTWRTNLEDTINQSGLYTGAQTAQQVLSAHEASFQASLDEMSGMLRR